MYKGSGCWVGLSQLHQKFSRGVLRRGHLFKDSHVNPDMEQDVGGRKRGAVALLSMRINEEHLI